MDSVAEQTMVVADSFASMEREMKENFAELLSVFREIAEQLDRIADRLSHATVLDNND
jgi:hypothetical protein